MTDNQIMVNANEYQENYLEYAIILATNWKYYR